MRKSREGEAWRREGSGENLSVLRVYRKDATSAMHSKRSSRKPGIRRVKGWEWKLLSQLQVAIHIKSTCAYSKVLKSWQTYLWHLGAMFSKTENGKKGICNKRKHSFSPAEKVLIGEMVWFREIDEYFIFFTRTLKWIWYPLCSSEHNSWIVSGYLNKKHQSSDWI